MSLGLPVPPPAPATGWGLPFGRRARTRRGDELPEADWVVRHGLPVRSAYTEVRGACVRAGLLFSCAEQHDCDFDEKMRAWSLEGRLGNAAAVVP